MWYATDVNIDRQGTDFGDGVWEVNKAIINIWRVRHWTFYNSISTPIYLHKSNEVMWHKHTIPNMVELVLHDCKLCGGGLPSLHCVFIALIIVHFVILHTESLLHYDLIFFWRFFHHIINILWKFQFVESSFLKWYHSWLNYMHACFLLIY